MAYNKAKAEREWLRWNHPAPSYIRLGAVQQRAPVPAATGGMVTIYRLGVSAGSGIARGRYGIPAGQHRGYRAFFFIR